MIEVTRRHGSITVTGHAHYAQAGKDIVCAGVSALVQTMLASIEILAKDKIEYDLSSGTVAIKYGELSECARLLVESFFIGIRMIAEAYPQHVKLV